MAKLREVVQSAIEEWKQSRLDETALRNKIYKTFDAALDDIICWTLGVSKLSTGTWYIDPHRPLGQWLRQFTIDTVKQYLSEHVAPELPVLTNAIKDRIVEHYKAEFLKTMSEYVSNAVVDDVERIANEILKEELEKFSVRDMEVVVRDERGETEEVEESIDDLWGDA